MARRAVALDPNSIDALTLTVVHLLAHDSNFPSACSRIGELSEVPRPPLSLSRALSLT